MWDPSLAIVDEGSGVEWPTPGPSTSTAATPSRCAASTRAAARARSGGSPAAATTRCTPAWPRPPAAACGAPSTSCRCTATAAAAPPACGPGPAEGRADDHDGMREPGRSVPPELLPEVSAHIRVVRVDGDALVEPPGELARGLNVVPSALPRLQATADGGLVVAYRIHRQLPLMTYYWEAAAQVLGPDGWCPPMTFGGTDATLEEVSLAAGPTGALLATQADGRLSRALHWSEGFGGRECPYLADHHGAVIWHGVHGAGQVVLTTVASAGPAAIDGHRSASIVSAQRSEARRWTGAERDLPLDGLGFDVYWGDLHRHSLVSRCTSGDEPSLDDFYRYAWDVNEYDFWAVTDHAENSTAYQWWSIQKIADLLHVPGRFVPLYGFEWTSAEHGHQNVIYGDVARGAPIFSAFAEGSTTPDGLWRGLAAHPQFPAITIPHHPGSAMVHNDWDYHDPRLQPARRGLPGVPRQLRVGDLLPAVLRRHRDRHVHARRPPAGPPVRPHRLLRPRPRRELRRGARPLADRALTIFEGSVVAPHLRGDDPRRARRPPARAAPDGRGARLARCPAADACTPAATPSSPGSTSCGTAGSCTCCAASRGCRRDTAGSTSGWNGGRRTRRPLGRAAVGGGRPARAARPRRPRGRGHGLPRRAVAARHAQLRRALRGAARWRRGQRLRPGRRAGDRRLRGPDRSGSGWPSWPNGWPRPVRARRTSRVAPAGSPSSPPSAPCSGSASAPSTSPSATTSR